MALHNFRWGTSVPCRKVGGLDEDVRAVQKLIVGLQVFFALVANVELPVIVEGEVGPTSKRFLVV